MKNKDGNHFKGNQTACPRLHITNTYKSDTHKYIHVFNINCLLNFLSVECLKKTYLVMIMATYMITKIITYILHHRFLSL